MLEMLLVGRWRTQKASRALSGFVQDIPLAAWYYTALSNFDRCFAFVRVCFLQASNAISLPLASEQLKPGSLATRKSLISRRRYVLLILLQFAPSYALARFTLFIKQAEDEDLHSTMASSSDPAPPVAACKFQETFLFSSSWNLCVSLGAWGPQILASSGCPPPG